MISELTVLINAKREGVVLNGLLRIIYIMSSKDAIDLIPPLIQLVNAKGRQRFDYPAVVSCGATDRYDDAGLTFSQTIDECREVFTHMSPLSKKDRNDQ